MARTGPTESSSRNSDSGAELLLVKMVQEKLSSKVMLELIVRSFCRTRWTVVLQGYSCRLYRSSMLCTLMLGALSYGEHGPPVPANCRSSPHTTLVQTETQPSDPDRAYP